MTASARASMLPPLTPEETQHAQAAAASIRGAIADAGGWLSFERFMELALYAPGLGYYSAGSHKIGSGGDFVTAPEVSDLFSRCLARPCAQVLGQTSGDILELGAGTGAMAHALLTELAARDTLPGHYAILEVSAELAERQRARLATLPAALAERVVWLDRLPEKFTGVVLANEVADALPCRRFRIAGDGVEELGVAVNDAGGFMDAAVPADPALRQACAALRSELPAPLPQDYTSEACLRLDPWLASLADSLHLGALLLFDYGLPRQHYYHPQRLSGTLLCHFRQRAHADPYINVGVQDITAWVDFTRVAEAALGAGLGVAGFTTQAAFLLDCGLEDFVAQAQGDVERARLSGEARRLIMPEEMGEAFKAMALTRGLDEAPAGFALRDLRGRL